MIPLWTAVAAWGGGFEVAQQAAAAGGTGSAGTARVDAASAWFAPAALADDGGGRFALGAAVAAVRIDATSVDPDDPWAARSETPLGTPPHLYASWAGHGLLAGIAVNTPFAGGVAWAADGPLRFEAIESAPRFARIAPFAGGRLGRVRAAIGFHVDAGALRVVKATDHVVEEGRAEIALRGAGTGADASVFVTVTDGLLLAASYKGRTRLALSGEADFDVPAAFAPQLPDQGVSATWRLPDRLALGVAGAVDRWRGYGDVVLTTWSVNDALRIDLADPASTDVVQTNAWRDSVALRGGGEVDLGPATLRAGGYLDGVGGPPGPTRTLGPSSPDGTRVAATVGAGVAVGEAFRVDAFGEALAVLGRTSTSADAPPAAYHGRAWIAGLTASGTIAIPREREPRPLP